MVVGRGGDLVDDGRFVRKRGDGAGGGKGESDSLFENCASMTKSHKT